MERVMITGLGVVSCNGCDVPTFWEALVQGVSGIRTIQSFDPAPLRSQIAGEALDFQNRGHAFKRMDRFTQFAVDAAEQALTQAGLLNAQGGLTSVAPERSGVCVGTGIGGEPFLERQHAQFLERGPGRYHPLTVPIIIPNIASANIAMRHGLLGPNLCVSTACATGNHSLAIAADQIRLGRADMMVAGGSESVLSAFAVDGYAQLRALSCRNEDPSGASCPFSLGRDGFVIAEGAGVLVLESLSHARKRGAELFCELAGVGLSADAHHLTAPHPEGRGAEAALRLALSEARANPEDVNYINAHGTSTPLNDALETEVIKRVFGPRGQAPPVSSIKSMIGHSMGAAAGLEAVCVAQTIRTGLIPPTINLHEPDPALDLDYVPHTTREAHVRTALSNAFAFGGQNAVLVFRACE